MDSSDEVNSLLLDSCQVPGTQILMHLKYEEVEEVKTNFQELLELFKSIDVDNDHSLCLHEVVTFLKSITDDLSTDNIEKIFDSLDQSGDRSVDFTEFKVYKFDFSILFPFRYILLGGVSRDTGGGLEAVRAARGQIQHQGGGGEGPVQHDRQGR